MPSATHVDPIHCYTKTWKTDGDGTRPRRAIRFRDRAGIKFRDAAGYVVDARLNHGAPE